jgi:hypothetical protein
MPGRADFFGRGRDCARHFHTVKVSSRICALDFYNVRDPVVTGLSMHRAARCLFNRYLLTGFINPYCKTKG